MNSMTDRMSEASGKVPGAEEVGHPKVGETYRCATCGMEVKVTADCHCLEAEMAHFHCCGVEMQKV